MLITAKSRLRSKVLQIAHCGMYVVGGVMGQCGSRAIGSSSSYIVVLCLVVFIIVSCEDRLPHESMIQCSRPEKNTLLEDVGSPVFINYPLPMRLVKGQEIIYKKYDVGQPVSSWYNDSYAVHSSKNHTQIMVHDHNTVTIHMLHINCCDSDSYSLELHHNGAFQCQLLQVILNVNSTPPCERVTEEFVHEGTEQYFTIRNTGRNDQSLLPTSRRKPVESDTYATEQRQFLYSGNILLIVAFVVILTVLSFAGVRCFRIHCKKLGTKTMKRAFQACPEKSENDKYMNIVDKGVGSTTITQKAYDCVYVYQDESMCDRKLQIDPKISQPMYYVVDCGSGYDTVGPNSLDTGVHGVYRRIGDVARVPSKSCTDSDIIGINKDVMTNLTTCTLPRTNQAVSKVDHSGTMSSSSTRHRSLEDNKGFGIPHPYRSEHHHLTYQKEGTIDKFQRRTVSAEHIGHFERDIVINRSTGSSGEAYLERNQTTSETLDRARTTIQPTGTTSHRSPASSSCKLSASRDAIRRDQTFDCSMASPYDSLHRDRLEIWKLL